METSVQYDTRFQIVTHFHTFFFTLSHTLHTHFTQSELQALKRGAKGLSDGPKAQKPSARARIVALKVPCF